MSPPAAQLINNSKASNGYQSKVYYSQNYGQQEQGLTVFYN
jgi:hypothetical protein